MLVADFNFKAAAPHRMRRDLDHASAAFILDADGKAALELDLRCQPARVAYAQLGSNAGQGGGHPSPKAKQLMAGNFRVKGLPFGDASHVVRVALPTLAVELASSPPAWRAWTLARWKSPSAAPAWTPPRLVLKAASDGQVSDAEVLSPRHRTARPGAEEGVADRAARRLRVDPLPGGPSDARKETLGGATLRFAVGGGWCSPEPQAPSRALRTGRRWARMVLVSAGADSVRQLASSVPRTRRRVRCRQPP